MRQNFKKFTAPLQNTLQYANYFQFHVRDVIRSHNHTLWRDWLQQWNSTLMMLQVRTSLYILLQVFKTIYIYFIAEFIIFYFTCANGLSHLSIYDCQTNILTACDNKLF